MTPMHSETLVRQSGGGPPAKPYWVCKMDGGGGGNRTRVLKPRGQSIYARIL